MICAQGDNFEMQKMVYCRVMLSADRQNAKTEDTAGAIQEYRLTTNNAAACTSSLVFLH
jgi:hypothetical protein